MQLPNAIITNNEREHEPTRAPSVRRLAALEHAPLERAEEAIDELGDELLWILARSIDVVAARDDDRQAERAVVRLGDELGSSLGGGVGVGGLERALDRHVVLQDSMKIRCAIHHSSDSIAGKDVA